MKHKTNGFTLIELLVVITIITILIAILLPALAAARKAAQTVQCLSQQKQMGIVTVAYANDHNGYVPLARMGSSTGYGVAASIYAGPWGNGGGNWMWRMLPYINSSAPTAPDWQINPLKVPLFMDPARPNAADPTRHLSQQIPTNYRYNLNLGAVGNRDYTGTSWMYPTIDTSAPRRLAAFLKPSKVIELADGNRNHALTNSNGAIAPDTWPTFSDNSWNQGAIDVGRHSGSENYLFVDGHAISGHFKNMDQWQFKINHEYYRGASR